MLAIEGLHVAFGGPSGGQSPALDDIRLEISQGEAVLACGSGASGKSVLLAAASGIIPRLVKPKTFAGRVLHGGKPIAELSSANLFASVGIVLQNLDDQLWNLGVEDLIAFPLENQRLARPGIRKRIAEIVELFGLGALKGRTLLDLSGGERRMAALAAAIACKPRLLVLDEPMTGLDPAARARLAQILHHLRSSPAAPTILAADQDASAWAGVIDRLALLKEGGIAADLPWQDGLARSVLWEEAGLLAPGRRRISPENGPTSSGTPLLDVAGLRSTLRRASGEPVLDTVSFALRSGEVTGLIGRNGAGKTTLFQSVLGLARSQAGRITIEGEDAGAWTPARRARRIGYLPQNMRRILFNLSVLDEAAFAVAPDTQRMQDAGVRAKASAALDRYGLSAKAEANPYALSAREQACLGLACLEAAEARIAILDEPLLARDSFGRAILERFVENLRQRGGACILISHDLELVDDLASRLLILEQGRLAFDGPIGEGWRSAAFARLGWPRPHAGLDQAA